jgi:2'-deoxynucleoside 5'-phosphate N-hydrolase
MMLATIYFSGSISGGRQDVGLYRWIVDHLEAKGHRVLAGAVATESVSAGGEALGEQAIFERDLSWIAEAAAAGGVLVADVSVPSNGVGYEIAVARYRFGMPVIALYRPTHTCRCSAMIRGDAGIVTIDYDEEHLEDLFDRLDETLGKVAAGPRE